MKQKTTRPSNYLYHADLEFNFYHTQTADLIYSLLVEGNIKSIEDITKNIPSKADEQFIQYAFMDKYGFNYAMKIQSIKT